MAKAIITTKTNISVHGITCPNQGDILFFCPSLNDGNLVAEYVDEEKSKHFAMGLLCLLFDGVNVRPYIVQYRSIWGVSTVSMEISDGVLSRTPQTHHKGTSVLFSNGSDSLTSELAGKALIVEKVYSGTFNKTKGGTFNWDLMGLGITNDISKVDGDTLTIGKLSFSLTGLQEQFNILENFQNERLASV